MSSLHSFTSFCLQFAFIAFSTLYGLKTNAQTDTWINVGNPGFSAGVVTNTCLALDGLNTPYVAYVDSANDSKATVMKYNGTSWAPLGGAGFSAGAVDYTSMAIDAGGTIYVAYQDLANSGKATVMKYNGGAWVNVGTPGFSAGGVWITTITLDGVGTPYISFMDISQTWKATVMRFDGNDWVNVGNPGFTPGNAYNLTLAIDENETPYVAFTDDGPDRDGKTTVMKFDGTNWVYVGSPAFSAGMAESTSIAVDRNGTPYVAFQDYGNGNGVSVMTYNGTSWVYVGEPGFSTGEAIYTYLALYNGVPYVAYQDQSTSGYRATVMRFAGSGWVNVGSAGFSASQASFTNMAISSEAAVPYVVFQDRATIDRVTVMTPGATAGVRDPIQPGLQSLSVYPDPCHGSFNLCVTSPTNQLARVSVTSATGEQIKDITVRTNSGHLVYLDVPAGVYFVTAYSGNEKLRTKIIVE